MSESVKTGFPYDAFVIAVLLAISCGCLVISFSQVEAILYFSDKMVFLVLISTAVFTILIALLAAFLRYQSSETENNANQYSDKVKQLQENGEADERLQKAIAIYKKRIQKEKKSAGKFIRLSSMAIQMAILITMSGFLFAVGSVWIGPINEMLSDPVAIDGEDILDEEAVETG